jgi:HD-GYP domain-containing protein (c-di-GMP phosphodiesterase class II)
LTNIFRNDLIFSLSYALDYVEREMVMVSSHHSKRVAYLAASMGRSLGYGDDELLDMASCAALHDNALSEYLHENAVDGRQPSPEDFRKNLELHCEIGERNISALTFYPSVKGAILYHHENADGSGYPFGLKAENPGREERLLACLDIYQALREERPYKPGMTHTYAMAVPNGMAAGGQLDAGIVGDINQCFKDEAA